MEKPIIDFKAPDGTVLYFNWSETVTYTCPVTGYPDGSNIIPVSCASDNSHGIIIARIIMEVVNEVMTITIRESTESEILEYKAQVEIDNLNSLNNN
jgi:hypothetical protein